MWPVKSVKDSDQIMFTVKFSSESLQNSMHEFIVSCQSICS